MTKVSGEEFIALSKMLPEQRFDYTIEQMIERQYLWGLYGENGWLMVKGDDDACVPVWPHEEFAAAWVKGDFPDCKPKQIEFSAWREQWLPGMQSNGTLILVFPLGDDEEGIMLEAQEMLDCIEEDLQTLNTK